MENNKSIGIHRLIILPLLFLLSISAIFLFHTIIIEQQQLKTVKQCLEDIRSDAFRIAGKDATSQKSYETNRLKEEIKKLSKIKKDDSFYAIIHSKDINLINSAQTFLTASINIQSSPAMMTLENLALNLDNAVSRTLVTINKMSRASLLKKIKIEYSLIILICILIILQYFIADSYMRNKLAQQYLEYEEAEKLIQKLTERDSLTNLPGRKKFYEEADREIASATRYSSDLTLIKMDINGFKEINKKHGQKKGDKILARFARLVRVNLRRPDSFFRVGGDKFVILAPHTTVENAQNLTYKINQLLKKDRSTSSINLTINIGIAACEKVDSSESLMKKVASALKSSKIRGAGEIAVYGQSAE